MKIIFVLGICCFFGLVRIFYHCSSVGEAACSGNCNYNGVCDVKHARCNCYEGFTGSDCKTDCRCNGHGTCQSGNICKCDEGWKYSEGQCVWDCHCLNGAKCIGPGECGCVHKCKMGNCRNGQCQCWNGYKGSDCSQYDANIMTNHGIKMGINVGGITYFSSEVKFVDIAKQSQEWITQRDDQKAWNTQEHDKVHFNSDGYPTSLPAGFRVAKLVYRGFGEYEETGIYTILWDGEGEIGIKLARFKVLSSRKGRMLIQFDQLGHGGFAVTVGNINPKNPVRNLRLIAPGYEQVYDRFPFHPVFLENLRRYSEIRYMDFYSTNGHGPEPTTWSSRHTTHSHSQVGTEGGALEYMIDLSNRLGVNPWFCIPHAADDNYVTQFATLVKNTLRKDLVAYVEYSNEVWNGIFRQAKYSEEKGLALKLDTKPFKAKFKYYNKRSTEVVAIWNRVFGSEANTRVSGVWAWQTGFQDYYRQAVEDLGSKIHTFKNIAITGYFDCLKVADNYAKELPGLSMAEIQKYCKDELPVKEAEFKHYMDLAKAHGVQLVMYEGGPSVMESSALRHFGQSNQATTEKAIAFNKDSHMEESVRDVLNLWNKVVVKDPHTKQGGFFNYFSYTSSPSKYGSWGMLQYTGQDPKTVAKFRGVQHFLTSAYGNVPKGPKCSFIKNGAIAYGCYNKGRYFDCGMTDDSGRTWNKWNIPGRNKVDTLVLDGYNKKTDDVYIRVIDDIGSNNYHVYNTKSHQWSTPVNFLYYTDLARKEILPPQATGDWTGLDSHFNC